MLHRTVPTLLRRVRTTVPALGLALGLTLGLVLGLVALGSSGSAAADDPRGRAHELVRGESHARPGDDRSRPGRRFVPHERTVVEVRGNRRAGFEIWHYDGSRDYPPTASETMAECDEHDPRFRRAACRAKARAQFNSWRDLRRAINYQQAMRHR